MFRYKSILFVLKPAEDDNERKLIFRHKPEFNLIESEAFLFVEKK